MRCTLSWAWLSLLSLGSTLCAQDFTVDWSTIDGGGGTSTGAGYSAAGIIGQPDAGTMSGGGFAVRGGFWSIVAAQQAETLPSLDVSVSNSVVRIWWSLPGTDFVLDQTTTLDGSPIPWTEVPFPYQTNATHIYITAPAVGARFYQLRKPARP